MAIAFDKVLLDTGQTATSDSFVETLADGGAAVGNLVVVAVASAVDDISSITDSRGNTYILCATPLFQNTQNPLGTAIAYSILTTALQNGDTITIHYATSAFSHVTTIAVSYSGLGTTPLDQQGTAQDIVFPQSQPVGPSVTITEANELLVSWIATANLQSSYTPTSNWTQRAISDGAQLPGFIYEDRIVSSIGTYNSAPTIGSNDYWNAHAMTFKTGVALDTVLPDADVVTTGWATAPLYSKLNDGSDATVITATAS